MNVTGWSRGLEVSGGGQGVVSHAGLALLRHLADKTGLTGGLARALATPRLLVHDRGRVLADLACAIADGAQVISDFRVMGDQADRRITRSPPPGNASTHIRKPLTCTNPSPAIQESEPPGPWNPGHPARQPGCCHTRTLKSGFRTRPAHRPAPAINPYETSGLAIAP
jgi:hypothetical protein